MPAGGRYRCWGARAIAGGEREGGKERGRPDFPGVGGVFPGRPSLSVSGSPSPPCGLCCCCRRGGSSRSSGHFKAVSALLSGPRARTVPAGPRAPWS